MQSGAKPLSAQLFFGTWCHNFLLWATYVEVLKMSRPPLALAIIIYHLSSIVRTIYNSLNYQIKLLMLKLIHSTWTQ